MNLKLDENVDVRITTLLRLAGHDVATVVGQGLSSSSDLEVIDVCRRENRVLVTSDRGFGNRIRFNPSDSAGIVVIRLPPQPNLTDWQEAINTLILGLENAEISGKLWIIQSQNIQEYQPINTDKIQP
jgi:predicted nuclease of predicted toxin-antitoxin system